MTVLEGRSVRLRPLVPADYRTVHAWYTDPERVAPFDRFQMEEFDAFVRSVETANTDPASLAPRFVVERREVPGAVGAVGYYRAHPVLEYIDVWYLVGDPAVRGQGLGREAVGLLIDHVFATETVERVGAACDVANEPSVRLLQGLGLRREGTIASALFHHGAWHDVHLYGVTRAAWSARGRPG
ncbi:MAG TPA: GNAT family protein [Thermoplasmata archaeon]|nr:GNAT family protein [Thermoplasmata archaeon]